MAAGNHNNAVEKEIDGKTIITYLYDIIYEYYIVSILSTHDAVGLKLKTLLIIRLIDRMPTKWWWYIYNNEP